MIIRCHSDLVSLLGQRGEKRSSHGWDGLLEGQSETIIEFLGANDAVLASIHDEATKTRVGWVFRFELWQEVFVVDSHSARNVILSFEGLDLAEHRALVLLNCLSNHTRQDIYVALSASQRHSRLDKLDQALHEQVLEQVSVLLLVVLETLGHLKSSRGLQTLDKLVCALHAVDTRFISRLRFLNLKVALSDLQVLEHLVMKTLLFGLDHFLRLHGEVRLHLLLNLVDTFATLLLNELDHAIHDGLLL